MKQLFNKHSYGNAQRSQHGVLELITAYIKAAQTDFARYLQWKTERLTRKNKKQLLLLFSLLFGSCSIVVLMYSFLTITATVESPAITFPKYATMHKPSAKIRDSLITHKEYEHISQFKLFLEHLQKNASGKKMYDSLILARPHLLDSLHQVDSIFLNQ